MPIIAANPQDVSGWVGQLDTSCEKWIMDRCSCHGKVVEGTGASDIGEPLQVAPAVTAVASHTACDIMEGSNRID